MGSYVIALDQGTTSCRAVLFDDKAQLIAIEQQEFNQIFPKAGWVEHDPEGIWTCQKRVLEELISKNGVVASDIAALGITNQRETTVMWDKETGVPVYNAIVWQDTRTTDLCEKLKSKGLEESVHRKTGLVIDSYFSATKMQWILEHVEEAQELMESNRLAAGTIDTWLTWKLTGGRNHVTDVSNASRTMIYNIHNQEWDHDLLEVFNIPTNILPQVLGSDALFGNWHFEGREIPIHGILGDQQAALFGQACIKPGMAKNTYGTGCFMLMNIGPDIKYSEKGLLTTIAWKMDDQLIYAFEGSIFIAGAAVQWLRDGLQLFDHASESENMVEKVPYDHGVYVVPAFAGLGAPYWDMYARGAIFGLTRESGKEHITRATLESMAYQTRDVLQVMENESGLSLEALKVDGGATGNDFLMQFQADILGTKVERPKNIESTATGAALMAGMGAGVWKKEQMIESIEIDREFQPQFPPEKRELLYKGWEKAVGRTMHWLKD